jgi:hypothetical protein
MKKTILLMTLFTLWNANAEPTATPSQLWCVDYGSAAVAKVAKVQPSDVSFFNGSWVGDGVDVIELDSFQIKGKNGLYTIELEQDDCSVFTAVKPINN